MSGGLVTEILYQTVGLDRGSLEWETEPVEASRRSKEVAMKVLLVSHYSASYGANRSLVDLAARLVARGVQVLVILPGKGRIEANLREAGIPYKLIYHRMWVRSCQKRSVLLPRIFANLVNFVAEGRLFLIARKWGANLVHINSSCTPVGYRSSRWLGIPLVWHIREYLEEDYSLTFMDHNRAIREMLKADRVIAVSKDLARKYQELLGARMGVIYNGVEFDKRMRKPILSSPRIELVMVGVLSRLKMQHEAIRAVATARGQMGLDLRLRIVGDGEPDYAKSLKDLVREFDLEDCVEFIGFVRDPKNLLADSDVALICSSREAFGRVTVEGMSSGLLVIASRSGGTGEIVKDKVTGLLYEVGDAMELAKCLEWVSQNRVAARAISRNGCEHSVKAFGMDRVADEVIGVYQGCIDSDTRGSERPKSNSSHLAKVSHSPSM